MRTLAPLLLAWLLAAAIYLATSWERISFWHTATLGCGVTVAVGLLIVTVVRRK